MWTITVLCLANERLEIMSERGTRVESGFLPGPGSDQFIGVPRSENSLEDGCSFLEADARYGQPSSVERREGFRCSGSTSPSAKMRARAEQRRLACVGE